MTIRPNYSSAACLNNYCILVEEQQLSSADVVAVNSFKAEKKEIKPNTIK